MPEEKKDTQPEVQDNLLNKKFTRRKFIQGASLTVGGLIVGGGVGGLIGANLRSKTESPAPGEEIPEPAPPASEETDQVDRSEAMIFFTRKEDFQVMAAATECIFPEDELGPGAIKLGVPFYIDRQLASPWGRNADDYMVRPFQEGEVPLTRAEIMIQGIRKLNEVSLERHDKPFYELTEEEQIPILQEFENGEVEMEHVSSAVFFNLLRQLTIEGCYCDPVYGGNRNMEGWKMKEFPGAYKSYIDVVESEEFVYKEPRSLADHF